MSKIDIVALRDAIDGLPIETVIKISEFCRYKINKSSSKNFKISGKQQEAFNRFFSFGVEDVVNGFVSIPRELPYGDNFLPWLLMQDWSHMFDKFDTDNKNRYCVYQHFNPTSSDIRSIKHFYSDFSDIKKDTFYIGKGTITRPYQFACRDSQHKKMIKESLIKCGGDKNKIVNVIQKGLTEKQALELEAKLIFFFKPLFFGGVLTNLQFPGSPQLEESLEYYANGGIKDSTKNRKLLGEVLSEKIF